MSVEVKFYFQMNYFNLILYLLKIPIWSKIHDIKGQMNFFF